MERRGQPLDVDWVSLPDGADFYMSPIPLGYYRYTDLLSGPLSIEHIAEIHDAIAFEAENRERHRLAVEAKR